MSQTTLPAADVENGFGTTANNNSQRHVSAFTVNQMDELNLHKTATNKAIESLSATQQQKEQQVRRYGWATKRKLGKFYVRQKGILDAMVEMEQVIQGSAEFDDSAEVALAKRALNLSLIFNCFLLVIRALMVALTGSLSLIIALIDGVLDVLSSCMMYFATRESKKVNKYRYPVGKHRLEPLGVIIFACVMGTSAFTVIIEGITQLINGSDTPTKELDYQWVIIGGTIVMVVIKLGLYLYCRRSNTVAVQAFAVDHLNDTVFNSFSLAGALLGEVAWYLDPTIAIVLALWVTLRWGNQGLAQVRALIGVSAPPEILQKLTYLAYRHRPDAVRQIDTVRAYTAGTDLIAEVDIVLDKEMPLVEAHDIGEDLQKALESLPGITRAFVHLDVESSHAPEH